MPKNFSIDELGAPTKKKAVRAQTAGKPKASKKLSPWVDDVMRHVDALHKAMGGKKLA